MSLPSTPHPSDNRYLQNFDELPNSSYVRLPVIQALLCCSRATVWRMVQQGRLPQPRKLSCRHVSWNVGAMRKKLGELPC